MKKLFLDDKIIGVIEYNNLCALKNICNYSINEIYKYDRHRNTIIHYAAKYNNVQAIEFLVKFFKLVDFKNDRSERPIHIAAKHDSISVIEWFFYNGYDVNIKNYIGSTPIHYAAHYGNLEAVQWFFDNGADINIKNSRGTSLVHVAASRNNVDLLMWLKNNNADLEAINKWGFVPAHAAAKFDNILALEMLYNYGIDLEAKSFSGASLAHIAAQNDSIEVFNFLLMHRININIVDYSGCYPIHIAARRNSLKILECFFLKGLDINVIDANGNNSLNIAIKYKNIEAIQMLCSYGIDLYNTDIEGNTAMHYAALSNDLYIIKFLQDNGVDLNSYNFNSHRPVDCAYHKKKIKSLIYLYFNDCHIDLSLSYEEKILDSFLFLQKDSFVIKNLKYKNFINCTIGNITWLNSKISHYFNNNENAINNALVKRNAWDFFDNKDLINTVKAFVFLLSDKHYYSQLFEVTLSSKYFKQFEMSKILIAMYGLSLIKPVNKDGLLNESLPDDIQCYINQFILDEIIDEIDIIDYSDDLDNIISVLPEC